LQVRQPLRSLSYFALDLAPGALRPEEGVPPRCTSTGRGCTGACSSGTTSQAASVSGSLWQRLLQGLWMAVPKRKVIPTQLCRTSSPTPAGECIRTGSKQCSERHHLGSSYLNPCLLSGGPSVQVTPHRKGLKNQHNRLPWVPVVSKCRYRTQHAPRTSCCAKRMLHIESQLCS
jgi:hypothetical protein